MAQPGQPAKKVGELLVEQHLITPFQLEQALAEQRSSKAFLGAILVRRGFIKAETLLHVLSEQFGIPTEHVSADQVDWRIVKQFPASLLSAGTCFPIRADEISVTVAIADPLNAWALSDFERFTGIKQVKPVLVLPEELQTLLCAYQQRLLRNITSQLSDDAGHKTQ